MSKISAISAAVTLGIGAQFVVADTGNNKSVPVEYMFPYRSVAWDGALTTNTAAQNTAAIQATIDNMPSSGGTVTIPAGTYLLARATLNYCLTVQQSGVRVILSPGAILKLDTNQVTDITHVVYMIEFGDGSTVFDGMGISGTGTLDYNEANQSYTGDGTVIRGCVKFRGSNTRSLIEDINCINVNGSAIFVDGVSTSNRGYGLTIQNTYIQNAAEGIVFRYINDVSCIFNKLRDITGFATPQDGIEPLFCDNVLVTNNNIKRVDGSGIDTDSVTNAVLSNNTVEEYSLNAATADGITLSSKLGNSKNVSVVANAIANPVGNTGGFGITCLQDITYTFKGVAIVGNAIDGAPKAGVRVWTGDSEYAISYNVIIDSGENGLKLHGTNITAIGNIIYDCGQAGTVGDAISINGVTGSTISFNTVMDRGLTIRASGNADTNTSGQLVDAANGDFIVDGVIVGDIAWNSTDKVAAPITVVTATALTITGDAFPLGTEAYTIYKRTIDKGMQMSNGSDDNTMIGNKFINCKSWGLEVNSGSHRIKLNEFIDCAQAQSVKRSMYLRATAGVLRCVGNDSTCGAASGQTMIHTHFEVSNSSFSGENTVTDTSNGGTPDAIRIAGSNNKIRNNDFDGTRVNDDGTSNMVIGNVMATYDVLGATTPISQINMIGGTWTP